MNNIKIANSDIERLSKKSYEALCNIAMNFLLRPNDILTWYGNNKEKFNQRKAAFETVLQTLYKDTELYRYYYELPTIKHGFCTFERWKSGMYF
ncbi:hypothetical protein [Paenibacillus xylaniclasticus]|uniref:hypothetical protein n=1 Tax=Paenibacillus xylaniclasticus TaxID=588083 RepID=UPI000FD805AE|nr:MULTISPECIES: hypothetical protein [Paenibacillus]GFN32548.1 hypothetical protein PCURB6_28080 [Paenibacillus curdlanolyticus]